MDIPQTQTSVYDLNFTLVTVVSLVLAPCINLFEPYLDEMVGNSERRRQMQLSIRWLFLQGWWFMCV